MTLPQPSNAPRWAGALYLAIAVVGAFGIGYVPQAVVVAGDAAASFAALQDNLTLFRLGLAADAFAIIFELALTALVFVLFHEAGPVLSVTALIARTGMAVVMGINLLIWAMPLHLMGQGAEAAPAVLLAFEAHGLGIFVWQIFFAVHLLALGALLWRVRAVPRLLSLGLFVGAFGYLLQGMAEIMQLSHPWLNGLVIGLLILVTLAELGFALWLLVRGPQRLAAK